MSFEQATHGSTQVGRIAVLAQSPNGDYISHMETTGGAINAAARKIKLELIDQNISKNALATRAGIASTSFTRKLEHPEQFTLKDLGNIAQALEIELKDLFQDAA